MDDVWELVKADMTARQVKGKAEYGRPVVAHDDVDWLQHAYEECLDMAVYLKAAIEQRRVSRQDDE